MSDDSSAAVYAALLDSRDQLLERHYHHLTRVIRPHNFFAWLRTKGVLSIDDQEEIEKKYITTCMRAGHLVDVIATKGKAGFIAFMEVIEYEYPELFTTMTTMQPRQPPEGYKPSADRQLSSTRSFRRRPSDVRSIEMMALIGKLTVQMNVELQDRQHRFEKLQELIENMKAERQKESEEHNLLWIDLQSAQETIEELTAKIEELSKELAKSNGERDELKEQCNLLRTQKDAFMDECTRLRLNCAGELKRTLSQRQYKCQFNEPNNEVVKLPSPAKESLATDSDVELMKLKLAEAEKDQKLMMAEKRISDLECQCQICQENSDLCLATIEQLKVERDQVLKQNTALSQQNSDAIIQKERLETECRGYLDKFRRMEETMQNLYQEIDLMRLVRSRPPRQLHAHPRPIVIQPPQPSHAGRDPEKEKRGRISEETPVGKLLPPVQIRMAFSNPDLLLRKNTSPQTIILFSPEKIHDKLVECLQPHYASPYVLEAKTMRHSDLLDEKLSPDGQAFRLTVTSIINFLAEPNARPCLLSLPATRVQQLIGHGIHVAVVFIKFKSADGTSEVSEIEEDLIEMCRGYNKFVLLEVDEQHASDILVLSQQVHQTMQTHLHN